jgi:Domain of unknown function (DUF4331)
MSNHYSAANLKFPGDDARLDFTDLWVFPAVDPGQTVIVIDVNPFTTGMSAMPPFLMRSDFHPDGVYRINVDRNGDALAEAAFTLTFSERTGGEQTGTLFYAVGAEARSAEPGGDVLIENTPVAFDDASAAPVMAGQVRLFIGVRSDPFFADADGSFHGFAWTGQDAFADRNVLSIVMEVPDDMLSADPIIGLWAAVSQRQRDGSLVQVDRGGHPTINPFVNPNNVKNTYNLGQPVDDVAKYLGPWSTFLEENGGYSPEAAEKAARIVLPDILRYDRGQPVGYPNGRAMTDDTFSARFAWMSDGKIPPQGLKPHADLLSEFPYLGPPNVYPL